MKRKQKLPVLARIFLNIFCNHEDRDELAEGILDNYEWRKSKGRSLSAYTHLIRDVIFSARFFGSKISQLSSVVLSVSFFKVSHRFILKNKLSSGISILSLLLGLTFSIAILTYTQSEKSWDSYIPDSTSKYRLTFDIYGQNGRNVHAATSPAPYGPYFTAEVSEIKNFIRFVPTRNSLLSNKGKAAIKSNKVVFGDSETLAFFGVDVLAGEAAFQDLNSVLISESLANKLYGGTIDALGKTISFNEMKEFYVKGVFEDFPDQSTVSLDMLGPIDFMQVMRPGYYRNGENWGGYSYHTYFEFVEGADLDKVKQAFLESYHKRFEIDRNNLPREYMGFDLINVGDIHLQSDMDRELVPPNNYSRIQLFEFLAFMIAIIGWINFTNIQISRAPERLKEMGIRKTLGANNSDLQGMFLLEYLLLNLVSFGAALLLVQFLLPPLLYARLGSLVDWWEAFTPLNVLFLVLGSTIAAVYPAIYTVIQINTSKVTTSRVSSLFQNGLVTVQFAVTIFLTVYALVIYRQVNHLIGQDPGFDAEKILVINGPISEAETTSSRVNFFKQTMSGVSGVEAVSSSGLGPGINKGWQGNLPSYDGENSRFHTAYLSNITDDFFDVLDVELLSGRVPKYGTPSEHPRVLINREAAFAYGWDIQSAIGKKLGYTDTAVVSGVVENFNSVGFQESISPMVFIIDHVYFMSTVHNYVLLKVSRNQVAQIIDQAEKSYTKIFPDNPFVYSFSDDLFEEQYKAEVTYRELFMVFSGLAILLALSGLIGLTIYHANRKRKEIGIRKVLGSGEYSIIYLFIQRYIIMIGVASIVSIPIAVIVIGNWLNDFASRIELSIWLFASTVLLLALFVISTICMIVYDAVKLNPVEVLKENG